MRRGAERVPNVSEVPTVRVARSKPVTKEAAPWKNGFAVSFF